MMKATWTLFFSFAFCLTVCAQIPVPRRSEPIVGDCNIRLQITKPSMTPEMSPEQIRRLIQQGYSKQFVEPNGKKYCTPSRKSVLTYQPGEARTNRPTLEQLGRQRERSSLGVNLGEGSINVNLTRQREPTVNGTGDRKLGFQVRAKKRF